MSTKKITNIKTITKTTTTNDIKYSKDILNKLYSDYKDQNSLACDVEIILNGKEHIFTHRILLEAYSNFFRNAIGFNKTVIEFNDPNVNLKLMKLMLKFFYKGTVSVNMKKYLENFKELAKKLEVDDLYNKLSEIENTSSKSQNESQKIISDKKSKKAMKSEKKEKSISKMSKKKSPKKSIRKNVSSMKKRNTKKSIGSNSENKSNSSMSKRSVMGKSKNKKKEALYMVNYFDKNNTNAMMDKPKKSKKYKMKGCS